MSKKTERKNKTNLVVNWPDAPFFTIEDLQSLNAEAKNITLRVRLSKEIEKGTAAEIGCKTGGQGRPKKVFAFTPVPEATLTLARTKNITLVDQIRLQGLAALPMSPFTPKPRPVVA